METVTSSKQYIAKGAEWQWCSFCRSYGHGQVLVPSWWVPCLEIDGNKLTAIPEILDMAYQDERKVNKWNSVPEQYFKLWDEIFDQNQEVVILKDNCPICNQKIFYNTIHLVYLNISNIKRSCIKGREPIGNGVQRVFTISLTI